MAAGHLFRQTRGVLLGSGYSESWPRNLGQNSGQDFWANFAFRACGCSRNFRVAGRRARERSKKRTCLSDDRRQIIFFNMNGLGPVLGSPYRCVYTCSDRALAYMRHTPHAARGPDTARQQAACNEGIRTGRMHRRHAGYGEPSTSTQAGVTRRPLRDPSLLAGSTTRFYDTLESLARGHEQPAAVSKLPELQRVRKRSARPKNPPSRS